MAQLISEIWEGLRDAGLPEVMLYLDDNSASRCHWDETTLIGDVRVALVADQDRKIVRILPLESCTGIGIASPKGTDPSGYKSVVMIKLCKQFGGEFQEEKPFGEPEPLAAAPPTVAAAVPPPPPPPPPPQADPVPPPKPDALASRFGVTMKATAPSTRPSSGSYNSR